MPGRQSRHADVLTPELNVPAAHTAHVLSSGRIRVPGAHTSHDVDPISPYCASSGEHSRQVPNHARLGWYWPAPHGAHSSPLASSAAPGTHPQWTPSPPIAGADKGGQGPHAGLPANRATWPSGHAVHRSWPESPEVDVPGAQASHAVGEPYSGLDVPGGHMVQLAPPSVS